MYYSFKEKPQGEIDAGVFGQHGKLIRKYSSKQVAKSPEPSGER